MGLSHTAAYHSSPAICSSLGFTFRGLDGKSTRPLLLLAELSATLLLLMIRLIRLLLMMLLL